MLFASIPCFDALFCNRVVLGLQAAILESLPTACP